MSQSVQLETKEQYAARCRQRAFDEFEKWLNHHSAYFETVNLFTIVARDAPEQYLFEPEGGLKVEDWPRLKSLCGPEDHQMTHITRNLIAKGILENQLVKKGHSFGIARHVLINLMRTFDESAYDAFWNAIESETFENVIAYLEEQTAVERKELRDERQKEQKEKEEEEKNFIHRFLPLFRKYPASAVEVAASAEKQAAAEQSGVALPSQDDYVGLVTLHQMAAIVQRKKRTLEKVKNKPPPKIQGIGGMASYWDWDKIRPWLEQRYSRMLPKIFPSDTIAAIKEQQRHERVLRSGAPLVEEE